MAYTMPNVRKKPKTALASHSKMPNRVKWNFPPTGGGISQGFNDSSQEYFKANILEHTVREIIQNSLDAKDQRYADKPAIVRMERINLTPPMVGGKDLMRHVEKSIERTDKDKQAQGTSFYREALRILKLKNISTLAIIDENTTGLIDSKWDALVYQEGTPNKAGIDAAGGSFGIGKNAPYAASKLSLVCYSTRFLKRNRIEKFIARSKLVAHMNPSKPREELQHIGFGTSEPLKDSRFPPIMGSSIRKEFRLPRSGSGVFIVGFMERNWKELAKRSIASNFFTAIHEKRLQVAVEGEEITNETLNDVDFGKGNRRHYYDIIKSTDKPEKIRGEFGSFELKVATGADTMGNRVAYVNRRGMLITDEKQFRKNPFGVRLPESGNFAAVMRAADDRTDERVRKMEPPTHETIEYERLNDPDERSKTESALREIQRMVIDHIKTKLNIDSLTNKTELTELADIIPFVSEHGKGLRPGDSEMRPSKEIGHRKLPIPQGHISAPIGSDGTNEGGPDTGKPGIGDKGPKEGRRPKKKAGPGDMADVRVMRHGDVLRVAFTSKARSTRFALKPAGEEDKVEDTIPIMTAKNASSDGNAPALRKNVITLSTKRNERVILDLSISQGESYTGYNVVEYETRGKK